MQNLTNIYPSDLSRIIGVKRTFHRSLQMAENDMVLDVYVIKFSYDDGSTKFIRVFCENDSSKMLLDDKKKNEFFVNRLFGPNGLIVKEGRNDYIYLGGVYDNGRRITRFNKSNNGNTMQENFDDFYKKKYYHV